ncbi:MAG: ribosome biogenesis GTPase Der [Proteobacteria bacterium]|jgi:GTP-binding protein|nr:ribosome biogenesis GTPase Der [Pseudomonadota bacterium]MBP08849.1 ribosome biogenesis GTPase Der [Acidiferrobacteraceae bacterium]MDP6137581.1 ribosome biogenesis GTPase Der [Arenicellales bacterium]HCF72972.1 ribosome biogenesis GTPase Der [Gammaproteobacteria bacterium]HJP08382.1 ribosome biogenesis GTPase Der [Arenicellales bacterium]|tara:strand:- start:5013 stop:6398 length:1386 start_codon:yes stop_codon:yes gene_type:complete
MLPVIAIIGRPNVGKSTLFNRLTRSRKALVDDQPGVTRDRLYGVTTSFGRRALVVDTGGLSSSTGVLDVAIREQVDHVVDEADALLFLTDARSGSTADEIEIAAKLRRSGRLVFIGVNKTDGLQPDTAIAEFNELALGRPFALSALSGFGVADLMAEIVDSLPDSLEQDEEILRFRVALVGRPNVGKSTLTNALLGENRVIVADEPGTTRDSVEVALDRYPQKLLLIDTAGVRRKSKVRETIEKFSVVKTLQAIADCHAVVHMVDGRDGLMEQDATIAGLIQESGRTVVVVVNKWDGIGRTDKSRIRRGLIRRFSFLHNHETLFISALHGSGVGDVVKAVERGIDASLSDLPTPKLNRVLADALARHPPPMFQGRPIRIKYVHQGGKNPPTLVIHGNLLERIPASYLRYLSKTFGKAFGLVGTPVRLELRRSRNPYSGRDRKFSTRASRGSRSSRTRAIDR